MIEYIINPDGSPGKAWSPYTGCLHGLDICPTSGQCWARTMSRRFRKVCGGNFEPRWHPERLDEPFHWRKPRRVATCFMGELFGDWKWCEWPANWSYPTPGPGNMISVRHAIIENVRRLPQHQFLFLTKRPENLASWNPWPPNAWVGTSITGAETPERQEAMLAALERVKGAGVRWLSYEPMLGPLMVLLPRWLDWLVAGAQSGKGATKADAFWLDGAERDFQGAVWEKNSLGRLRQFLRQELPE